MALVQIKLMDNLDKNIMDYNLKVSQENKAYRKALGIAMEGLKNIEKFDNTNISELTIREIYKVISNINS
tara:strand:+ start:5008 stop:5217 length:210 start_codon:yes stop_codon:yes gene_type:complete